jgi:hypothetical protein
LGASERHAFLSHLANERTAEGKKRLPSAAHCPMNCVLIWQALNEPAKAVSDNNLVD